MVDRDFLDTSRLLEIQNEGWSQHLDATFARVHPKARGTDWFVILMLCYE